MTKSPRTISPDALHGAVGALPWLAAAGMLAYTFVWGGYLTTVMSFALIYVIFVTGLNIFMGFAGQVSFGHNAFAALSGYTSAVLTTKYGLDPLPAFGAGLAVALVAALVLGLVNTAIRPLLILLTLPATLLTLGLFIFVINGLLFWFVGSFIAGFTVSGFWPGVFGAIAYSVVSWAIASVLLDERK